MTTTKSHSGIFNMALSYLAIGLPSLLFIPASAVAYSCGDSCHSPRSSKCTIIVEDILRLDSDIDDVSFQCILDPIDSDRESEFPVPLRVSDEQKETLHGMFDSGEIISGWSTFGLDQDMEISHEGVFVPLSKTTFQIGEGSSHHGRHLVSAEGDKPILVVKVIDSEGRQRPESTDTISDDIFGTYGDSMTLKSQMGECSFGKFNIIAGVGDEHEKSPGVIEVTIDKSLVGNSRETIRQAAIVETELLLGHSLPGPYSNVMFVLENCYQECGWAAYAYVNSWLSVYQGHYYKLVGVQMHEIGHNINLAHSGGLDGKTYTDHTGLMGNPLYSDDIGAMCFNAAKNYQLPWYDSNTIIINPRDGDWIGKIVGIADFANNPDDSPVVIKIETGTSIDQFIAFNRATGINRHNDEADNEVTIVEAGNNGEWYSQSFLKATLRSGEVFTMPQWDGTHTLTITAQSININTGSAAGYAIVSVCLGPCVYPTSEEPSQKPTTSPTNAPTHSPTSSPTKVPTIEPTAPPTNTPTHSPTSSPTKVPTISPTASPVNNPKETSHVYYSQMGIDIDGSTTQGFLGKSVSVSKDGLRMAIAATGEQGSKGVTRAFQWNSNIDEWIQLGQDIVGTNDNDGLGWSMDMNEDGSRIILGAPEANSDDGIVRVYELDDSNTWQLLGSDIQIARGSGGQAGFSVTMNASGDIVAYGAPRKNNYAGQVQAFELLRGQWIPMGQDINPFDTFSYSGGSISMSADGTRIVVGSEEGYYVGSAKVYDFDGSQWQENGSISGRYYYDRFGGAVDISEDGSRIIVGARTSDGMKRPRGVFNAGEFQVFEYDGRDWNVIGQKIIGSAATDKLGESVSISGDGTTIAISSPNNDENGNNAGKVEVYKYSEVDDTWIPQGQDILGECEKDRLGEGGSSIALDRSGNHLAVGAIRANYYSGMARVFETVAGEWHSNIFTSNDNCDR